MTSHESFKDYDDDVKNTSSEETFRWHIHDWNKESSKTHIQVESAKDLKIILKWYKNLY